MGKKRAKSKASGVSLSPERYEKILLILLEALEAAKEGQSIYWDLGPGERPQKISAEFLHVAKQEKISLLIRRGSKSLNLIFPDLKKGPTGFRVRGKDGQMLAEGTEDISTL